MSAARPSDGPIPCPSCGYDLSGLALETRTGDCPECGRRMPLGTELAAIKSRLQGEEGRRRCPVCARDLTGFAGDRCPGCGSRYRVRA